MAYGDRAHVPAEKICVPAARRCNLSASGWIKKWLHTERDPCAAALFKSVGFGAAPPAHTGTAENDSHRP